MTATLVQPDRKVGLHDIGSRLDALPVGPGPPQGRPRDRARPVLRGLRDLPVQHDRDRTEDSIRPRRHHAAGADGVVIPRNVHRCSRIRPHRRPHRPAAGLPHQPGVVLGVQPARRRRTEPDAAGGARFLAGIGIGAEYPVADSYLSDVLPKAHRGRLAAWAYTCSFLAVPALGFLSLGLNGRRCSAWTAGGSCW